MMMEFPKAQTIVGDIPNLINGISQQPSNIRFTSQGDECVNCYPLIQTQLGKRPPLETLEELSGLTLSEDDFVHWYRRDESEGYAIILNGTTISVVNFLDGTAKTVTMSQPGGDTYHQASTPKEDFFAYTYKDTTWIVNRSVECAMDSTTSAAAANECIIVVDDAGANFSYSGTVKVASTNIAIGYTASSGDSVAVVAANLQGDINAASYTGLVVQRAGHVIHVSHPADAISVDVNDNRAGTAIHAFSSETERTEDLPPYGADGYVVKVTGTESSNSGQDANTQDDVYYTFDADNGNAIGSGVWKESVAPGITYMLDAATMPHQLVRQADGSFDYDQVTWVDRRVGDDTTNPIPPFIESSIHSLYIASNRLGIVAGGASIASKADEENYYDFFRTTVLTNLDTDPVRMQVPSPQANELYYGIQWNGDVVLFGQYVDGVVSWNQSFAPNKINIDNPTNLGPNPLVAPLISGSDLYFTKNQGDYSHLYRYTLDDITGVKRADNISDYCGSYIPRDVIRSVVRGDALVVMLADGDRQKLYCYNYAEKNNQFVQQAFHHWEFDENITIYSIYEDDSKLYLIYGVGSDVFVGRMDLAAGAKDVGWIEKCYLDHRIQEDFTGTTVSYDSATNRTAITLPHEFGATTRVVELRAAFTNRYGEQYPLGHYPPVDSQNSTTITLIGDWEGADVFIGIPYTNWYIPNKFHVYRPSKDGTGTVADSFTKLYLQKLVLNYVNTIYTKIDIIKKIDNTVSSTSELKIQYDNQASQFDTYALREGQGLFTVHQSVDDYRFKIYNDTSKPSYWTSLSFLGEVKNGAA